MEKEDIQKQQLQDYVNYLLSKGYSKSQIKESLIEKGFDRFLVREIIYPNLKLFVSAGIIYILMILVIIGFLAYAFLVGNHADNNALIAKNKTNGSFPIAPIPETEGPKYTLGEIISKGASEGPDFCNTLERADFKESCMKSYISNKAKQELDASVCEEINDDVFIRQCQYSAIVPVVAKEYNEESKAQNNESVAPSNIDLCGQIDNEQDRAKCYNPKQAIKEDYHLLE